MTRIKRLIAFFTVAFFFIITLGIFSDADARRQARVAKDPDAPTEIEAKVLGWGPVKTPNRGKRPEFLIRGIVLDVKKSKEVPNQFDLSILPIEALENHQRHITMDHFINGLTLTIPIPKPRLNDLKKGRLMEFHQYYTEEVEQSIGGAKMIAMSLHQDIQGYPKGAGAYLKNPGFYPIQYKNAIKGVKSYAGIAQSDPDVKAHLDHLATKSGDTELKQASKVIFVELYQGEPTGKCLLDKALNKYKCN